MRLKKNKRAYAALFATRLSVPMAAFAVWQCLLVVATAAHAQTVLVQEISSDKARYSPGEAVQFELDFAVVTPGTHEIVVRYRHLSELVETQTFAAVSGTQSWTWNPPADDYRGYMAEVEVVDTTTSGVVGAGVFGVDVSSDWAKFPRYGFLSKYDQGAGVDAVLDNLNRFHINGLQFYDWGNKHHKPLRGTAANPAPAWPDIANRINYFDTVEDYVSGAQARNMTAMAYNLAYGALDDAGAAGDGVQDEWYLYRDTANQDKDIHTLPSGWLSDIYLTDPTNTSWQQYIAQNTAEAFAALPFDGWHIDQLGDRGAVYDYNGNPVDLSTAPGAFVGAMKAQPGLANSRIVFNAVNQYGQASIAASDVEFLYTEVWQPNEHFNDLASILHTNHALSNGQLNSVLAAYLNYDLADSPGAFNAPGVLLADAVIFAFGGAHIELGEHMLGKEYFPNNNLQTPASLTNQLTHYYDFLVGYQNLLRDGGEFGDNPLRSTNTAINMWPAQQGSVSVVNKSVGESEVFHLLNFTDATHMQWRDTDGTQPEPTGLSGIQLQFHSQKKLSKLWAASPDHSGGAPSDLGFSQLPNGLVVATLPSLKYWSMVVAEGEAPTGSDYSADEAYPGVWAEGSNGGQGFGPWQLRSSSTPGGFAGFWKPDDASEANNIDNAGAREPGAGSVWSSFANKGAGVDKATAYRTFLEPLNGAGDSFTITLEHGLVFGKVGLSLRTSDVVTGTDDFALDAAMQLYFEGGDTNYTLLDGSGVEFDTGVGFTNFGITAEVTLTGPNSYDLTIWRYDEENDLTPQEFFFSDRLLASGDPITSFALFQYDSASAVEIQGDVFFNHLSYTLDDLQPGDFNEDGEVDALDLGKWEVDFGVNGGSDGDGDSDSDLADLLVWQRGYQASAGVGQAVFSVPEPSASACLLALFLVSMRSAPLRGNSRLST